MFTLLAKSSIRFLLAALLVTLGLLLVGQSIAGFQHSYKRFQDARLLAVVSLANAPMFASLTGERLTRGLVSGALLDDLPVTDAAIADINENRRAVDQNYHDAMRRFAELDLPGLPPVLARLRAAHDAVLAVRPAADIAIHLPKAERDPNIVRDEPIAIRNLQQAVQDTSTFLENVARMVDPMVDHLRRVRRASRAMRGAAGDMITRIETAASSRRAWTRADITEQAADHVRLILAWHIIEDAVAAPYAPPALVSAAAQAKKIYFAYLSGEQRMLTNTLRFGYLPELAAADIKAHATEALKSVVNVADAAMQAIIDRTAENRDAAQTGLLWHSMVLLTAISVTVSGCLFVDRRISRPVRRLTEAMGCLAQNDAQLRPGALPGVGRVDEIGVMAGALQVFRVEMARADELAAHTAAEMAAQTQRAAEVVAEIEGMAERQGEVVETVVFGLMQLSEGNLAFQLLIPLAPEYEMLRVMFNDAVMGLQGTVRDVLTRATSIGSSTGEIAQAADDLARRTQKQAASLEQTAAALAQLTATVRQTAAGSARAKTLAATARSDAEMSARVVAQTQAAMEQIDSSAKEIGQIIGLIDEIAFQTNLLALNAGVEAARAGDKGRSFAVIASEVRALAQRAGQAANEIKSLVQLSMQHVARGVGLVGETGQALGRIEAGVHNINGAINEIAAASGEQSNGLAEVNDTVTQMDQVTQQNAAMVEQSTAATHSLAQETQELTHAMQTFKIDAVPSLDPARAMADAA